MSLWFDVTSLFSWNRPVTGVTRVELECARVFLATESYQAQFIRFDPQEKRFSVCLPSELLERLTFLETLEGRPAGKLRTLLKKALAKVPDRTQTLLLKVISVPVAIAEKARVILRKPAFSEDSVSVLRDGDVFVTVGFDLGSERFKVLLDLRREMNFTVVSCCHDLIPWARPDLTLDRITRAFVRYLDELLSASDHVVCVSSCTSKDLGRYLEDKAHVPTRSVIRLGSRVGPEVLKTSTSTLESIVDSPFILYVSTLERRKNHEILLDAYRGLLDQGVTQLPKLVMVGMSGWGAEGFFEKLEADAELAHYILLLHHVSDNELSQLYKNALFTVYPSLYEGWGLPVAESLAYGKFCIASDAASIPEVGGDLVQYCSPHDVGEWSRAIHYWVMHAEEIVAAELKIRQHYQAAGWDNTVAQIMTAVMSVGQRTP